MLATRSLATITFHEFAAAFDEVIGSLGGAALNAFAEPLLEVEQVPLVLDSALQVAQQCPLEPADLALIRSLQNTPYTAREAWTVFMVLVARRGPKGAKRGDAAGGLLLPSSIGLVSDVFDARKVCGRWARGGWCPFGSRCLYEHPALPHVYFCTSPPQVNGA